MRSSLPKLAGYCWFAFYLTAAAPAASTTGRLRADFDEDTRRWTLANSRIQVSFELNPAGNFLFREMYHLPAFTEWRTAFGAASSPIRLRVDDRLWDGRSPFRLVSQRWQFIARGGLRQTIVLAHMTDGGELTLEFEIYDNQPVLRYGVSFLNTSSQARVVSGVRPVEWTFADSYAKFDAMHVEQWMPVEDPADFEPLQGSMAADGRRTVVSSGAHGRHCSWLALSDRGARGMVVGWEFNGRMQVGVSQQTALNRVTLDSYIPEVYHPVEPGERFQAPRAFLGLFSGDWDDAGFVTQRFVEQALAKQVPKMVKFPFVSWDSWGYGQSIDEATLRRNAAIAARLGVELFVVDLGWARAIGDWREDPAKFPSGLRALSDYVHSLGMKFGLHFAFAEADDSAPVLQARSRQDWTSSVDNGYFGARSLCLAHKPVRQWVVDQAVRMIDDYKVDWILQDGENMVKQCTKTTHTHHPDDSNYANAVDGLDWVLAQIQERRPDVLWENCENGGNLMTFQMVQQYVTSIVNDASGARGSRQSVYGATYPFPARYSDRYMPEEKLDTYTTRSYLFGGPWIFMNRLDAMTPADLDFAAAEIALFKRGRDVVANGRVSHLTAPPGEGRIDALAAFDARSDAGMAVVTRDGARESRFRLYMNDAVSGREYTVRFGSSPRTLTMTGDQLRLQGVDVDLPQTKSGEVVFVDPLGRATVQ